MKDEYIIINKSALQKRIEELENGILYHHNKKENLVCKELSHIKLTLEEILSQSTPLLPEIEKAFGVGASNNAIGEPLLSDYITNLKLDI